MPAQLVEYLSFVASEAFIADSDAMFGKAKAWLDANAEGCLNVFFGFQVEDSTRAQFLVLWETYEHFTKNMQNPNLSVFREIVSTWVKSDLAVQHIDFDNDPSSAFSAPITELSLVKPKSGHAQEEIDAVVLQLRQSAAAVPGVHPTPVWGNIKTTPQYAMAVGWDSLEAHKSALHVSPVDALAGKLFEISEAEVKHVSLKKAL